MSKPPSPVYNSKDHAKPVGPPWLYRLFHEPGSKGYGFFHHFLSVAIFVATLSGALETVDALHEAYATQFRICELTVTAIFTLEYIGHLMTTRRKLAYIFSFWGMIDLFAIVPTFFQIANVTALKSTRALRVLRVLRVMRVLKLAREAMEQMQSGVQVEMRKDPLRINLLIYSLAMFSVIIISSTLVFYAEFSHGEVDSVQRLKPTVLRFQSSDLPLEQPGAKISIAGESPFAGTWELKAWDSAHHHFDVIVPDDEVAELAGSTMTAIAAPNGDKIKWEKDTPFTSVPQSMWWCITTLTTVGYGDIAPVTVSGRLVAAATMLCGLVLFGMLMNIIGKAMMVALFGTDPLEEAAIAPPSNSPSAWNPQWRHCPTCGHKAEHDGPGPCHSQEAVSQPTADLSAV